MSHWKWGCSFIWVDLYQRHCRGRRGSDIYVIYTNRYQLKQKAYHAWEKGIYTYSLQRLYIHYLVYQAGVWECYHLLIAKTHTPCPVLISFFLIFFLKKWPLEFIINFLSVWAKRIYKGIPEITMLFSLITWRRVSLGVYMHSLLSTFNFLWRPKSMFLQVTVLCIQCIFPDIQR